MKSSVLSLAALAPLLGSAFLIPASVELDAPVPVPQIIDAAKQTVKLPCPSCPAIEGHDGKTALVFKFKAGHGSLTVNDASIVPFQPVKSLNVYQVPEKAPYDDVALSKVTAVDANYELYVAEEGEPGSRFTKSVATIEITSVRGKAISQKEAVQVKYVRSKTTGDIYIISAETKHFEHNVGLDGEDTMCESLMCKLREAVSKKVKQMKQSVKDTKLFKGCNGKPFGWWRPKTEAAATVGEDRPFHRRPHGFHPHPHSHGGHGNGFHGRPHWHDKEWSMVHRERHHTGFFGLLGQIFVPVLIGIFAGILVSLVTVFTMQVALFAVRKLRGMCPKNREQYVVVVDEESGKGLLEEEEYTDAPPVYEETHVVVVDEKQ